MKIIITALAAMLLCIACENKSAKIDNSSNEMDLTALDQKNKIDEFKDFSADSTAKPAPGGEPEKKKQPAQTVANPDWDKKIIKTASLNFEVKDYNAYYTAFREKVRSMGGYVAQEEQTQSDYKIENTLTVKVPVDQFDNAVNLLTNNVEKVNERKITSQDVTTEFVDTKSRMESKKRVRDRYLDLLKQAKNMEEILNVQSEINGIQEEVESAAGRIEFLGHAAAYSTINITYYQVLNSSAKDNESPAFGSKISTAFKTGWSWISDLFVGLVSIWPLVLLSFGLVILYKKMKTPKPKQA